jgi:predicted nucleotidyltransferase
MVRVEQQQRTVQHGDEQGQVVLAEAVGAYREALGQRLVAAYALGSLAHGGFSPLVSDVDLGLVLADPLGPSDPETVQAVADRVKARGSVLHERLSVFWGTPSTLRGRVAGGRFPPLDRLDLLENGRLLNGEEARQDLARPGRAELLVAGAEFALDFLGPGRGPDSPASQRLGSLAPAGEEAVEEIRRPERLVARGPRHLTKMVLFPVRFLFTAATGQVGTNQAAVDHYLADDRAPGARLVAAALTWRTAPPDDDEAAAELLGREIVPLYLHYIDDHTARLDAVGEVDLAEAFERWRARLLEESPAVDSHNPLGL